METVERNEVFDMAYRFATETAENIFLTGKAGTGKTTFLKYLRDHASKNILVAAPTGVAAINAGGVTLHSLFQLPFHPFLPTKQGRDELLSKTRITKQRQQLLRKMELLVIDEVSMVRCDVMDAIDTLLKSVRRNYRLPFGGVQVLYIGDLYQLPPVAQQAEWSILSEYYPTPFFFDSHVIREQVPLLIELQKIYRQKESHFVDLLNSVRNNVLSPEDFQLLHERYVPGFIPPADTRYITLTSHNNQADKINNQQLGLLPGQAFTYTAEIEDEFPENMYPAESDLVLKEGTQVMFIKNDAAAKKYFNGKIGRVKLLEKDKIIVESDGEDIDVRSESWENIRYTLNRADGKLQQETLGRFTQYPLRLAWAITIHKSQGLTFDHVMIDAGAAFSSGQVYVALSRCTSLDGIVLLSRIPANAIFSNGNIARGQQSLLSKNPLPERFANARQIFISDILEEVFSFNGLLHAMEHLDELVSRHHEQLNKEAAQWMRAYKQSVADNRLVGLQFLNQAAMLHKQEPFIENNEKLRSRLMDAANHFVPKLESLFSMLQNHPLVTEHKEAADAINESMVQLAQAIHTAKHSLAYCQNLFSLQDYLAHKLKLAIPRFNITCYARGKKQAGADVPHPELFDTLKRWRDMVCEETGMPIFMVANQSSLKAICSYLPMDKKQLQLIPGFGKTKSDKYGDDVIAAVETYCSLNGIVSNMEALLAAPKKERKDKSSVEKTPTKNISFQLFKAGKRISEIAEVRKLTIGTVGGHLAAFVASGEIDINEMVDKEKQQMILDAVSIHGSSSLTLLIQNLPEGISYSDVRMVLAAFKPETQDRQG